MESRARERVYRPCASGSGLGARVLVAAAGVAPEMRPPFPLAGLEPELEADEEWTGEPAWLRERAEEFAVSISARAWTDDIAVPDAGTIIPPAPWKYPAGNPPPNPQRTAVAFV